MQNITKLYETDYDVWFAQNLESLRQHKFDELDINHLIEEMEDMGKKSRRELASRMVILLAHLLKLQYQFKQLTGMWQEFNGKSWRSSIVEQRIQIERELKFSPSLKAYLDSAILDAYPDACKLASQETGFSITTFPAICPYSVEQILAKDFYPN